MDNFIIIAVGMLAGMGLRAANLLPHDAHKGVNAWILYVALPAAAFRYIPGISWSVQMLFPVLAMFIVWLGSWGFMEVYCRYKKYKQSSRSALELASGYSNTSFIGFPLVTAYFGEQYLSIAIICDQTMFFLLSTAGIISAIKGDRKGGEQVKAGVVLKRLFSFPPFIACITAIVLSRFFDFSFATSFCGKLAATIGPLAVFSVGLQLNFKGWVKQIPQLTTTMVYKLILGPVLVLGAAFALGIKGDIGRISIFEAAMPTVITSSIIAEQFNLNSRLINLVIGVSIVVGFVTTACWYHALRYLGV